MTIAATFDHDAYLRTLSQRSGVYRMLDADGEVIYVGKARSLKNRVSSYFRGTSVSAKVEALRRNTASIEVTVTETEAEALLLESNLIKRHRPRFNVTLRDDKSYPYIHLESQHAFPRLAFYRGSRQRPGRFFGPYPSAWAVRDTLNLLQKLFLLRSCSDSFFANRSRPCLQYQIKRCSAPCVAYVSAEDYAQDVGHAVMFLEGEHEKVIDDLVRRMESASTTLEYERAAAYRDQIAMLRRLQEQQAMAGASGDADVIAAVCEGRMQCVSVMSIRSGRNLGTRTYFPASATRVSAREVVVSFLGQYYLSREAPREVLTNLPVADCELLEQGFAERAGHKVEIRWRLRGVRSQWMKFAQTNAEEALRMRLTSRLGVQAQLDALRDALELDAAPERIECFDVSHTMGESTTVSCVVFGEEGALKSQYRRFNVSGVTPGDDYGALRQALMRRYTRVKQGEAPVPDLLLIDGGKGQVAEAARVLEELQLQGITVAGVAKGPSRRPGQEQLFLLAHDTPVILPPDSPALHLIQQVRDEAHRFAITGHRQRRATARTTSILESIPGLGPKKRRDLLRQFGGLQGVARASIEELAGVHGINRTLAQRVYETLHED
jgi:excinuclease ABC subunit C